MYGMDVSHEAPASADHLPNNLRASGVWSLSRHRIELLYRQPFCVPARMPAGGRASINADDGGCARPANVAELLYHEVGFTPSLIRFNSARYCLRVSFGLDVRPLTRLFIGQPAPDCSLDRAFAALGIIDA
jgi:hypothetical protein